MTQKDFFNARSTFDTGSGEATLYRLSALGNIERLPFSIRVLLENVLRNCDGYVVTEEDVKTLANYNAQSPAPVEIPFKSGARGDAGLHRRAGRRRSGGDASGVPSDSAAIPRRSIRSSRSIW